MIVARQRDGYYTHCDEKGGPKNHYLSDPIGDPVAYEIETFISLCAKANLKILEILPGVWTGQRIVPVPVEIGAAGAVN